MGVEISKSRFKAQALEIFRRVEETGQPVVITDHGTPTLIIKKYVGSRLQPLEQLKHSVLHYDLPLEPAGVEDWDALG